MAISKTYFLVIRVSANEICEAFFQNNLPNASAAKKKDEQ